MLKLKNCSIIFNNNNCFLNKASAIKPAAALLLRFQSTASVSGVLENETNSTTCSNTEWQNAKPFKEIPTLNTFKYLRGFLPGGRYAKLDNAQLMLAFKNDFGDVSRLPGVFGKKDMVVTHNVEDFEKILRNEGIWPNRPGSEGLDYHRHVLRADFFQGVEGLIATQGETWGVFRSTVNPVMLQPKNVRLYLHKMSQVNKEFIERIRQIRDPQTLEVPDSFKEEINRWTFETVAVVALDKQLDLINEKRDNPKAKALFKALTEFFTYAADIEFKPTIWKYYKTPTFKKLMNALDVIMNVTSSYVSEATERLEQNQKNGVPEKPEHEKSMLEKLIKIDKKIASVMAMDMLMVGVDTTSSTFAALLLCLAKNPDKQEKLRQEVLKVLPKKDSDFDANAFKNMPYLRACIKESQRQYPLVVSNARIPIKDVVLSGYRVPKGTEVSMCTVSFPHDSKYFPRPNEFLPERWLRSSKAENERNSSQCPFAVKGNNPFLHLPFGFGARSCIGRRIVELELELGIARMVRNYQIEFNYPTDNAFINLLISVPNIPLNFKFTDLGY